MYMYIYVYVYVYIYMYMYMYIYIYIYMYIYIYISMYMTWKDSRDIGADNTILLDTVPRSRRKLDTEPGYCRLSHLRNLRRR